jgi:hypothetical protein
VNYWTQLTLTRRAAVQSVLAAHLPMRHPGTVVALCRTNRRDQDRIGAELGAPARTVRAILRRRPRRMRRMVTSGADVTNEVSERFLVPTPLA